MPLASICAICGTLLSTGDARIIRSICPACVAAFYGLSVLQMAERRREARRYLPGVTIKSACAWCQLVLRPGIEPATHSICDKCLCALVQVTPEELAQQRREWAEEEKEEEQ